MNRGMILPRSREMLLLLAAHVIETAAGPPRRIMVQQENGADETFGRSGSLPVRYAVRFFRHFVSPGQKILGRCMNVLGRPQSAFHGALHPTEVVGGLFAGEVDAAFWGREDLREGIVPGSRPGVATAREGVLVPAVRPHLGRGRLGPFGKDTGRL